MESVGIFFFVALKILVLGAGMFLAVKWHVDQDRKVRAERGEAQSLTEMSLFVTMIIASALSIMGIVYAGCWGDAAYGGLGGALGFALTILTFLMAKPSADLALAQSDDPAEAQAATLGESLEMLAKLRQRNEQWHAAVAVRLGSWQREKFYVSFAGVVSVLAWKFGDVAAGWLNIVH